MALLRASFNLLDIQDAGYSMETVLQYEIPALHPLAVHFPIALLIAAFVVCAIWLATGGRLWRRSTAVLLLAGAMGSAFAYFTGEAMYEMSEDIPVVDELIELHETLALVTLWIAVLLSLGALVLEYLGRSAPDDAIDPVAMRLTAFVCLLVVALVVAATGHVGATMVWGVAR